jgi:hypothetical protein
MHGHYYYNYVYLIVLRREYTSTLAIRLGIGIVGTAQGG